MEHKSSQFNLQIKKKIASSNFKPQLSPISQMVQNWGGSFVANGTDHSTKCKTGTVYKKKKWLPTPLKQ